jgi:hypothetical protein
MLGHNHGSHTPAWYVGFLAQILAGSMKSRPFQLHGLGFMLFCFFSGLFSLVLRLHGPSGVGFITVTSNFFLQPKCRWGVQAWFQGKSPLMTLSLFVL